MQNDICRDVSSFLQQSTQTTRRNGKYNRLLYAEEFRPIDFRWSIQREGNAQVLTRPGGVSPGLLGGTLFACVLLIGIPAVLAGGIVGMWMKEENLHVFQWVFITVIILAVFPIGLWGIFLLFMMGLQFFCRYKITLDDQGIQYCRSWFGIGRNRFWPHVDFNDVSVECRTVRFLQLEMMRNPELADAGDGGRTNPYPYAIQFANSEGRPLGIIPDLLEGEAQWIARQIREMRKWN